MAWILNAVLVVLLVATLLQALRLERAVGALKRDRVTLQELVDSFNTSTRQAEAGVEQLRTAADGAGRELARQIEAARRLKDDLSFLLERGDPLADRLESHIRAGRPQIVEPVRPVPALDDGQRVRSQAERDLIKALRMVR